MNNWINNLSKKNENLTLNNLILPGTHNSASYKLNLDNMYNLPIVSHIIENWTLNQKWNIYQQLVNGVRMFDIDISYFDSKFYTSHTFIAGELEELIEDLKKYNNRFGDIYILKFICRDIINNDNVSNLANILINNFESRTILPSNYPDVLNVPISTFINDKKNMIIYMEYHNHNFFNTGIYLYSSWTNDNEISNSISNNKQILDKMNQLKTCNSNVLTDLNWTLTPTYKEVIYGIFCCCDYYNIKSWIRDYNTMFFNFYSNNKNKFNNINVISFDFINVNLVSSIVAINLKEKKLNYL